MCRPRTWRGLHRTRYYELTKPASIKPINYFNDRSTANIFSDQCNYILRARQVCSFSIESKLWKICRTVADTMLVKRRAILIEFQMNLIDDARRDAGRGPGRCFVLIAFPHEHRPIIHCPWKKSSRNGAIVSFASRTKWTPTRHRVYRHNVQSGVNVAHLNR